MEEIKERIKALEEISEENEEKFDDIYVALTELTMKQKLAATHRNPIGFIKTQRMILAIYQIDKLSNFC